MLQRLFKTGLIVVCALLFLTGCVAQGPETKRVKQAIAYQFQHTQAALSEQLRTEVPSFTIKRVEVREKTPLRIDGLLAYHLSGEYDVSVKFSRRSYGQEHNPFDLYLQQQAEENIWRLAVPKTVAEAGTKPRKVWETFAIMDESPPTES